jgi:hypothetical protein
MSRRIVVISAFILLSAALANGNPAPETGTTPPVERAFSTTPAYAEGRHDRKVWEHWSNALALSSYKDGALWWFGERSKAQPRGCVSRSGITEWVAGCKAAQQRLALPDIRRKTEAPYSLGWNSEVAADNPREPITMSEAERAAAATPAYADGRRDRENWEDWLVRLPIGSYRDGAFWWSDEHGKRSPGACESPAADTQWESGCRAAQRRIALPDVRRMTEADYRIGWNSSIATPTLW